METNITQRKTHRWRCMNCGKMADAFICSHCGKESCKNFDEEEKDYKKPLKEAETKKYTNEKTTDFNIKIFEKHSKHIINSIEEITDEEFKFIKRTISTSAIILSVLLILTISMCFKLKTQVQTVLKANNDLKSQISLQTEEIKKISASSEKINYIVHKVEQGENLESICNKYNIDFSANKKIILSFNGIENENILNVGQTIILFKLINNN